MRTSSKYERIRIKNFVVKHKIPCSDLERLEDESVRTISKASGFIFGYTLTDQIQGQLIRDFPSLDYMKIKEEQH